MESIDPDRDSTRPAELTFIATCLTQILYGENTPENYAAEIRVNLNSFRESKGQKEFAKVWTKSE